MSTSSILLSQKKILMHFKNRFKVYLKYTSLLNSWWIQSISEKYKAFSKLFSSCFQSYKLWKSQFCLKVYLKYTSEVYLKNSLNSAGENTSRGLHNLWGNGLVVRCRVTKPEILRLKPQGGWKTGSAFHTLKIPEDLVGKSKSSLWLCSLQTTELYLQSSALRQMKPEKGPWFFCKVYLKYTSEVQLKYTSYFH